MTITNTEAVSDAIPQALINEAIDCENWPMWLHDIVDRVTGVDFEHDMSTEQAIGLALLLSRRAANSAGGAEVKAEPAAWVVLLNYGNGRWSDEMLTDRLPSDDETQYRIVRPLYTHPSSPVSAEVTVDDAMVERALEAKQSAFYGVPSGPFPGPRDRIEMRAALLAALNGKE